MTPAEAQMLLGIAASFDNRKPNEEAAVAWSAVLGDLEFVACRDAIVRHYRESRDWIMPADVVKGVRAVATERMRSFGTLVPPESVRGDIADERKWLMWARDEVISGRATRPGDVGMDDTSGYPVRDLRELGINPDREPQRLANPEPLGNVTEPVERLRSLVASVRPNEPDDTKEDET